MLESSTRRLQASAWLLLVSASLLLPASSFAVPAAPTLTDLSAVSPESRSAIESARSEANALDATGTPAARAEAWGKLGMLYLHERLLDAAEPCFQVAVEAQPDQMRWSYYLAVVQQKKGDLASAAANLRKALAVREGNLPVALRLAGVLAELGDAQQAGELYSSALQSPLGLAGGYAGLGHLAMARAEGAKAAAYFRQALEAQPEATALHRDLSLAYAAAGDLPRSRQEAALAGAVEVSWPDPLISQLDYLSRAASPVLGEDPKIDGLRRAVVASPDDAPSRRTLAQALVQAGDLAGAQEQYEEILRRKVGEASDYLDLGSIKADLQRDVTAGIPDLKKALELDPRLFIAHQRLAHMLTTLGKFDEAIGHLKKALEIEPGLSVSRLQLARTYFGLGKFDDAALAVAELLRREPGNFEAVLMRGRILAGQNKPDEARQDFERVASSSTAAAPQRAEAFYSLGLIDQASSNPQAAAGEYAKALEQDPMHAATLSALGTLFAGAGQLDQALPLFQRLASRDPENLEIKYRLAALQMQRGDAKAAQVLFEELYQAQPQVPEFIVTSALMLAETDQLSAALARLDQALPKQKDPQIQQRLVTARARIEARAGKIDDALVSYGKAIKLGDAPDLHLEMAQALALANRSTEAVKQYDIYLAARPQDEATHFARAMVLIWAGRFAEARDRLVEVTAKSQNIPLTHLLARVLASAPDAKVRNGERALQIAKVVFESEHNPVHGETLALALAAAGHFPEAVSLQKRLLFEAEQAKFDEGFITRVKKNLAHYEKGEIGVSDW